MELEQEGHRQLLVEVIEAVGAPTETQSRGLQGPKSSLVNLQALTSKLNQMSVSSPAERSILCEFYEQLRQIRGEMNRLNENFKEERRHRKRLQEAFYRKVA